MKIKFNLGAIDLNIPAGEQNPEIRLEMKDISYEVDDLSLTEYGSVLKGIVAEAGALMKEFHELQQDDSEKSFDREQIRHEMRMKEIKEKERLSYLTSGRQAEFASTDE